MEAKILRKNDNEKESFFYGRIIIAVAALGLFFSGPGQTYFVSMFVNSYIEQFGWSRSTVSRMYSFATLLAGFLLPFLGRKIDKAGHRKMITIISLLLAVTCLWMSFVFNPFMLFVGFMFLRLLGQGSMTLIPSTLVSQWFVKRRGYALSIMRLGLVISSAALPLFNNWLVRTMGIKFTWIVWSVLLLGVMAPLGWKFVRNSPEEMNLMPDGVEIFNDEKGKKPSYLDEEINWTVKEATKTRAFWLMLFNMSIPAMINTGLTFHIISIIGEKGFTPAFAATILTITAVVQFPMNFLAGYLVDRIKVHYIKGVSYWFLVLSMLVIIYSKSSTGLIIYGVLNAVFVALDSVSTEVLWPNYFGRKYLGSIRSLTMTSVVIGSALGPLPFGYAYDLFKGYKEIIVIMMTLPILGSITSFLSPPPKYIK